MIKADAYGLGASAVARALELLEPWGYGVATVDEAHELRDAGIGRPILIFTPLVADDFGPARDARATPALGTAAEIACWSSHGGGRQAPWHLAIDTGMSRAGARWDAVRELGEVIAGASPEGAFTHFHSADRNDGSVAEQERRFAAAIAALPVRPRLLHAENAAAVVRRGRSTWSLVRPGIFLYGVGTGENAPLAPEPVVHVRARVVDVRWVEDGETVSYAASYRAVGRRRVATIAVGYADGYRRALSNRGTALVHGHAVPVAGLVTMDMTMLDVTGVQCAVGDVATLIGRDGDALLDVETVARTADISPYELLTGLRQRLARVYLEHGSASGESR